MAAVIATLTILGGVSAIVAGIAKDQGNLTLSGWAGLISPVSLVDGIQVWLFGSRPRS